jgi:prolyl 4-hydroxylase
VLYAVGGSRRHGIAEALDALAVAADRGWQPARAQLRLLAAEHTAGECVAVTSNDWRRLRNRIDAAAWRAPPTATSVSLSPVVQLVPDLLSAAVCQWLIDRSRGRLARAKVYEALSKRTTISETRTNSAATFNLLDLDVVTVLVQTRLAACAGIPFRQLEPLSVLHYAPGEEITEHYDFVDPNVPDYEQEIARRGQRVVTFLVYLNDDYAGGATEFPEVGVSHKGRRGEGLFFGNALADGSADVRTVHAGRPPTSGEKWIVSQFMRDRATL